MNDKKEKRPVGRKPRKPGETWKGGRKPGSGGERIFISIPKDIIQKFSDDPAERRAQIIQVLTWYFSRSV